MKRYLYIALILLSAINCSVGQIRFKVDDMQRLLLDEINRFRKERGLETLESVTVLKNAAQMSATDMADEESEKTSPEISVKYLQAAGATVKGSELTGKSVVSKGKEDYRTVEVAKMITEKWESNDKSQLILLNPMYKLCGVSAIMDEVGEKVYVSIFFGGYDIVNDGVRQKKQLEVPYNTVAAKLQAGDVRSCKNCSQFRNYELLQQGITVEGDKIIIRYPNAKELKRLLKKPTDGIAVDIVQKAQYQSAYYNIMDNNLQSKGVMTKVMYKDDFFAKNKLATGDKKNKNKVKGIEVEMGKFNPKIKGPYELNLIVVQDNKVCKTVIRGYTEKNETASNTPMGLLPVKSATALKPAFEPRNESSILNFIIPFQKNKSEFEEADIEPFLAALNEPEFIIEGLYIYAYSSIEGDSLANVQLQKKRAESVLKILQERQTSKINPTILYRDSWGLFLLENEDGKYADIVNLGKQKAIARINGDKALMEELEPILARERFAQIILDVTYDIKGDKEAIFAASSLQKALKSGNANQSAKILDFIKKRIAEGKYKTDILDTIDIPAKKEFYGLANNKIYHQYNITEQIDEEQAAVIDSLLKLYPNEPALIYNSLFCKIKLDSNAGDQQHYQAVQATIDGLYGSLDSAIVNGLNIEWQFKLMESLDTLPNSDQQIENCINRIKSFYKIKDASWQNAMKLCEIFARTRDYVNAAGVLEPYLKAEQVNENLLFMYLSVASRTKEKYYTHLFVKAMDMAKEKYPDRYCKLIGAPYMSFQVLENPDVKKTYQLSCGK